MTKRNIISIFYNVAISIIFIMFALCFFIGCTNENSTDIPVNSETSTDEINSDNTIQDEINQVETIKLNSFNYSEYFILQEEVLSFEQEKYLNGNTQYVRATQLTKISILKLKDNMTFNNVEFNILYGSNRLTKLKLAYDGSGFTTVGDIFSEQWIYWSGQPRTHSITDVIGSISFPK